MLEVERKWLVRALPEGDWPVQYTDYDIEQVYLVPERSGAAERVRSKVRLLDGSTTYYHTSKVFVQAGVNEETEREISEKEFHSYKDTSRDPKLHPIRKIRRVFDWEGRTFELDMFRDLGKLVLLELEGCSVGESVDFPPFLTIEEEVTSDKRFSNISLAALEAATIQAVTTGPDGMWAWEVRYPDRASDYGFELTEDDARSKARRLLFQHRRST